MTLEETIREATPTGGVYKHDCPGGWIAYAAKSPAGDFICQYVKENSASRLHVVAMDRIVKFAQGVIN